MLNNLNRWMAHPFSYNARKKLKNRKLIRLVFEKGDNFVMYPVRVFYSFGEENLDYPLKVGVGTTKRKFHLAVHRSRIRRLLRESYRLHQGPLFHWVNCSGKTLGVYLLYIGKDLPESQALAGLMPKIIRHLIGLLHGQEPSSESI